MNHYKSKLHELLTPLIEEVLSTGDPDDALSIACSLEGIAGDVRKRRLDMICSPELRCYQCGRQWTAEMTVARLNSNVPDNCPSCYNKSKPGNVSVYTDTFRYISK